MEEQKMIECGSCKSLRPTSVYRHELGDYHIEINLVLGPEPYESDRDYLSKTAFVCGECHVIFLDPNEIF